MLNCAISFEKYQKVSRCKTRKEIWDKLQVTYEGTTQVKETMIDILSKEYEIFSMKEGELIDDIFERLSIIINSLDAIRITHSEQVLVRKVLRSLTKDYCLSDDEFVFFARKLRRKMRLKRRSRGSISKELKKDLSKVICHNYREAGNHNYDCPKLKKEDKSRKDKKNELMTSWKDLENDIEEDADSDNNYQGCLMANHSHHNEKKNDMWYLDSGCSRHMTGKSTFFIKLDKYDGAFVISGDNGKGKIVAIGKVKDAIMCVDLP
ncbi:uncharacterized protein [Arachis hypogaea]|uniref:uncharacterized protein n=1 Tax=Arachis hypogaea TaxID=3818 RepID=UPI003B214CD1